jgi:hypothetical protein
MAEFAGNSCYYFFKFFEIVTKVKHNVQAFVLLGITYLSPVTTETERYC